MRPREFSAFVHAKCVLGFLYEDIIMVMYDGKCRIQGRSEEIFKGVGNIASISNLLGLPGCFSKKSVCN